MKNTDKKTVFCLAWQFFKQTGYTFSECLKKAWANIKLKAKMKSQIVRFYFLKVDGTIREAWGTICPTIVPLTAKLMIQYRCIMIQRNKNIAALKNSTL